MQVYAFAEGEKERWRHTSMLAYLIGKFGNSDPKKYPASIKKMYPELWDDEEEKQTKEQLMEAVRKRRLQKK
jgi:hypothetical protein